jgi:acyl carrier protein
MEVEMTNVDVRSRVSCEKLAEQLREKPIINDAEVLAGPEPADITALVVRQGYRPGPVFRDLVMRLAGEDRENIRVAIVARIPRHKDGTVDLAAAWAVLETALVLRFEPPATEIERRLAGLVQQVLPQVSVSMTDDLVSLGGDSLIAVELVELIAEQWGAQISGRDLFAAETIRDMGTVIAQAIACPT